MSLNSTAGRLVHWVNEAVRRWPKGHPWERLSFSEGLMNDGWPKVTINCRAALRMVPQDVVGGVYVNRPHGEWVIDEKFEIPLDASRRLRGAAAGFDAGVELDLETRYRLIRLADPNAYAGALTTIPVPVYVYLGWEPEDWQHAESIPSLNSDLADLLMPELVACAARRQRGEGRRTTVIIDGLTIREHSAWMMDRIAGWGMGIGVEDIPEPLSIFDRQGIVAVGSWENYVNRGGAEAIGDRKCRTQVLYLPEQGATPEGAAEALRAGADVVIPFAGDGGQVISPAVASILEKMDVKPAARERGVHGL